VVREWLGINVDEMHGGHLVAISRPKELADRLEAYREALADGQAELETDLTDGLGEPARRALAAVGYTRLKQFTQVSEEVLMKLRGMGPKARTRLSWALAEGTILRR
jgi:hypothetical protein